ncbi:MAG TPA: alpha-E domain-containing protein [Intrasporangium sp.]|uniref:alpha-E domain-containing protein n=1 Tax=Intrasporangium sp. TaxID=1925024 RepID=UPI002D7858E3|nr:alpha-E domain-containing protein [Intrasporangium sp.]HET7399690.1 alpha-E domain-containing protein [Intrasporangium sp.]
MLSRLAENLFWIGRYVERAEDTTRLLDVHAHVFLEDAPLDLEGNCRTVLSVMGVPAPEGPVGISEVLELLAFDTGTAASITRSLVAARENARGARDAISSEMFNCLNRAYHRLPGEVVAARRAGPDAFFSWVRATSAEFHGLADCTMSRDEGWLFLVLGRSLERVDMTARLLATRAATSGSSTPTWVTLLRFCGAYEAHLRTYRGAMEPARVAEFLLLDRLFPRSVFSALRTAENCLIELQPLVGRAGVADEARRALGRARTSIEYGRPEELLERMPAHLEMLQAAVAVAADAVARRYFRPGEPVVWHREAGA